MNFYYLDTVCSRALPYVRLCLFIALGCALLVFASACAGGPPPTPQELGGGVMAVAAGLLAMWDGLLQSHAIGPEQHAALVAYTQSVGGGVAALAQGLATIANGVADSHAAIKAAADAQYTAGEILAIGAGGGAAGAAGGHAAASALKRKPA